MYLSIVTGVVVTGARIINTLKEEEEEEEKSQNQDIRISQTESLELIL